jgi:hypothetical protein
MNYSKHWEEQLDEICLEAGISRVALSMVTRRPLIEEAQKLNRDKKRTRTMLRQQQQHEAHSND